MRKLFEFRILLVLCLLALGVNGVWAKTGDELASCQGTGSGYGTRRTLSDSHNVDWVLSTGQTGYLGTKKDDNHGKVKPTAADLPVVKAVSADATTETTGYYFYYTTTAVANVGSVEFSYTANNGNASATAYVVVGDAISASGGDAYEIVELATTSTSAQGASLGTSGTFTFTFKETQTSARYYGVVIVTSSFKRMTAGTIKLLEGETGADANFSFPPGSYNATYGSDFSEPALSTADGYDGDITYSSSNELVATVNDKTGDITLVGEGTTRITASGTGGSFADGSAYYNLTVTDNRGAHGLAYATDSVTKKIGVTGYVNPLTNPNSLSVTYESDNTAVATVNATTGAITALTAGVATITASFTGNATYKAGSASYILTVSDGAKWVKVTDAANLHAGDQIIIVNESAGKVLSTTQNTNNRKAEGITLEGGIATMNSDAQIITLSKNSGGWILNVDEGHLYTISSSNHLKISSDNTALATEGHYVTINITSGNADIQFPFTGDDKYVKYNPNNGDPIFSAYKSGQSAVQIYKKFSDVSVTVSSVGYATLHYGDRALTVPAGMEAYTYLVNAQNKLEKRRTYEEGDVIPAGQAVVLKADAGTYIFELAATAGQADGDSQLKGLDEEGTTTGTGKFYHLTLVDKDDVSKGAGFFWGNDGGAAFTIAAHKAYLVVPTAGVSGYMFNGEVDDDLTAIESAVVKSAQGPIYDLQGRRVEKMTRGIYLVDGKKVMK